VSWEDTTVKSLHFVLRTEADSTPETLVPFHGTTLRHNLEDDVFKTITCLT